MIFSLEALQAGKGDSLVLHYGKPDAPRFIVIDGGPPPTYDDFLRPRLEQLHKKWNRDDKLFLDMVMVSHIDDDHIQGILDWMKEIEDDRAVPCNFATMWYNSFDAILTNTASELRSKVASLADDVVARGERPDMPLSTLAAKVIAASVGQGRQLRERADTLGVKLNGGFNGLVMAQESGKTTITRNDGLKLHVVGPSEHRLKELQVEWDKHVRAHPDPVVVASFADRSVANLSSIVVVAELGGKRMLLTGDARGDDILSGLAAAGLLDSDGKAHFDILKLPHHGSNRNVTAPWFKQITADHYVISANGEHSNPDAETVGWVCAARGGEPYTVHMTNEEMVDTKHGINVGKLVNDAFVSNPGAKRKVVFRNQQKPSVIVDLLDKVNY